MKCRLGHRPQLQSISLSSLLGRMEEKAKGMRKTEVLLSAIPLASVQWEQLSVLSLFLSVPSASWQAQAAGMWGYSVLLFAGLLGCERLVLGCNWPFKLRLGWAGSHCTAPRCNALADCCFCSTRREEEPLPGAPARHGRPFLCEALMATRWRVKREEEGSFILSFLFSLSLLLFCAYSLPFVLQNHLFFLYCIWIFLSFFSLQQLIVLAIKRQYWRENEWGWKRHGETDVSGVQIPVILAALHTLRHKRCHYDSLVNNDSPRNCIHWNILPWRQVLK